jgi:hypothetical protein
MSTDFSIKPVGAPAAMAVAPAASEATHNAVATELPAGRAVTAADTGAGVRNDSPLANPFVSRQAFLDRAANAIVYQVIDDKTNQVVNQYPDEATLRRRAYFHTLDMAKSAPTRPRTTDLKA